MTPRIAIVAAQMKDAVEIARLSSELGYATNVESTTATLKGLLNAAQYFVAVARGENPDQLLGWIVAERRLWLESGEGIEITGLVVSNSARRQGVGSALVAASESWAVQLGFRSIRVRSNVSRMESHPFYRGMGFSLTKTQHAYEKSLPDAG